MKEAENAFYTLLRLEENVKKIGLMMPGRPHKEETCLIETLHKSCQCVVVSGKTQNLEMMQIEWKKMALENHALSTDSTNKKTIRLATVLSVDDLQGS